MTGAAQRAEVARQLSVNSTNELDRRVREVMAERDRALDERNQARAGVRKAEEELARAAGAMKRWMDMRDAQRTRADNAEAQLRLHRLALERVHEAAAEAATSPGLESRPLQDRSIGDIANSLAHLAGQLGALPELLTARARREGQQVVEATARLILPRVHDLAPGFPFGALLEDFATPEEENEANVTVEPVVDEVKEAARRD